MSGSLADIPTATVVKPSGGAKAASGPETPFMQEFLIAGSLSAISKTVVAPFERARLVMQTQGERIRLGRLEPAAQVFTTTTTSGGRHHTSSSLSTEVHSSNATTIRATASGRMSKTGSFIEIETVGRHPLTTARDSFNYCIKNDGVMKGLFRGNSCTVGRVFITSATSFAVNGSLKKYLSFPEKRYGYIRNFAGNILMGGISGTVALVAAQPIDYIRTRLAADVKLPASMKHKSPLQFKNVREVCTKTIKSDGIYGFYRGFGVSSFAVFVKTGLYFGIFDTLRPFLPQYQLGAPITRRIDPISGDFIEVQRSDNSGGIVAAILPTIPHDLQVFVASSFLGWFATVSASTMGYPFETARRRMMMTAGMEPRMKYTGALHCIAKVIKLEGYHGLMRGASINAFTAVSGGFTLAAVDYGRKRMIAQ